MHKFILRSVAFLLLSVVGLAFLAIGSDVVSAHAQQPTVAIATVTGTPIGPYIVVNADQDPGANVRSGPGTEFPIVGLLVTGEQAPVKGKSVGGNWYQIVYPGVEGRLGWVYAPLVTPYDVIDVPIVEPPSTPTPRVTPTIDPTLAAQFVLEIPATRLPTFTAVEPLDIPAFEQQGTGRVGGIPVGMFITAIGLMGLFGAAVSYLRER